MEKTKIVITSAESACEALDKLEVELKELRDCGYKNINCFHAIDMGAQEIRHSAFIAWLLDPNKEHGLKDLAVRELFKHIYNAAQSQETHQGVSAKKNSEIIMDATQGNVVDEKSFFALLDKEIKVETEKTPDSKEDRIDVLLNIAQTKTVMVIENKIHSDTHTDQLRRYQKAIEKRFGSYCNKLFVFLTPDGQLPVNRGGDEKYNDKYCILSYQDIIEIVGVLKQEVQNSTDLSKTNKIKLKILLEDYEEMVNIEALAKNTEVKSKCKAIMDKYGDVLELLNSYTDNAQEVFKYCVDWLKEQLPDAKIKIEGKINKGSVNFSTEAMREFYKSYGESVDTHKTYKISTEAGNVIEFFIILDHDDKHDWTDAQKLLVPAKNLKRKSYRPSKPILLLTWDERGKDMSYIKPILTPILEEIKNKIIKNDQLLVSLTKH